MNFGYTVKHAAQQQIGDTRQCRIGHISVYDVDKGFCRVIFPDLTNYDGKPIESPWMELGSFWVGDGFGFQYYPHGGSTPDDPTRGEMVLVTVQEKDTGLGFGATMLPSSIHRPPNTSIDKKLLPGEAILFHESHSLFRFHKNGDISVSAANSMFMDAANLIALNAKNIVIAATENVDISAKKNIYTTAKENIASVAQKNFTVQATKNISMAAQEDFGVAAFKDINLNATENFTAESKNSNVKATEKLSLLSSKTIDAVAGEKATFSGASILLDAANDLRLDGGKHAYLYADAVNIYAYPDTGRSISTTLSTRTRPDVIEQIADIKINGVSINTTRAAVARINFVGGDDYDPIEIMNGAPVAEVILGGTTTVNQPVAVPEADAGEVFIDAKKRAKVESKDKVEILGDKLIRLNSKDEMQINANRLMGIASSSLKIRAVNRTDSDLTILGSRINIATTPNFSDGAYTEVRITTPADSGDFICNVGGKMELDVQKDLSMHATGSFDLTSYDDLLISSIARAIRIGQAQPGLIEINCDATLSLRGADSQGSVTIGGQTPATYRLLDQRFLAAYNGHTHTGVTPGVGSTGTTGAQGDVDQHCTYIMQAA